MRASKLARHYLPELRAIGIRRKMPSMVTVNLTNRCNQRCIYCEIGTGSVSEPSRVLEKEDLFWIIDEMSAAGIGKISLCGGEPFLFDGLYEVIDYAGRNRIRCAVTTNGMTAYKMTDSERELLRRWDTEVNISIDSFDPAVNGLTRGIPEALGYALKSAAFLSRAHIPVTLLCVISMHTYSDIYAYVEKASGFGISQVLFQPVITVSNYPGEPVSGLKRNLNVPTDGIPLLMDQLDRVLAFERKNPISTNAYRIYPWIANYLEYAAVPDKGMFFTKVLNKFWCREIEAIIDITYDGGIQPCGLTSATRSIFEDRKQGLLSQWREATQEILKDIRNERYYEQCNACCNHFSRNMLASMMRYPFRNRRAIRRMVPVLIKRMI